MKNLKFILTILFLQTSAFLLYACGNDEKEEVPSKVSLICQPTELSFSVEGGQKTIKVEASREFSVFTEASWLSVTPSNGLSGSTTITVTAKENGVYADAPRTATITVKSGTTRTAISVSQLSPEKPAPSPITCPVEGGYELVWNDEFDDGDALDTRMWTHEVQGAGWVNHELQTYVNAVSPSGKRVTELSNGTLRINCFKEGGKIYSGRVYGNKSKGFLYGVFEARIKLPKGKGTWPAWWMMPVVFTSWPHCGEIDIMEEVGYNPNQVSSSIHCTSYNHTIGTQKTHEMNCSGAEGEFHTYTLEWTEDYIQTYVDGKKQLTFVNDKKNDDNTWPFHVPFYPILNLAWGGDWGGSQGVDESVLPVTMEVDYVRVFQK